MIKISYAKKDKTIENWEEKLTELVVGFKMKKETEAEKPVLQDGKTILEGETNIQKFIDDLEKDINNWRTPRCGV